MKIKLESLWLAQLVSFVCLTHVYGFIKPGLSSCNNYTIKSRFALQNRRIKISERRRKDQNFIFYKHRDAEYCLGVSIDPVQGFTSNESIRTVGTITPASSKRCNSKRVKKDVTTMAMDQLSSVLEKQSFSTDEFPTLTIDDVPTLETKSTRKTTTAATITETNDSQLGKGIVSFLEIIRNKVIDTLLVPEKESLSSQSIEQLIKLRNQQQQQQQIISLVDIRWLKTHEEVLWHRVDHLKDAIKEWNAYKMPLLVDRKSGAILDGHHRYHVGCLLGLSRLPVVLVDYLEDDSIDVDVWPACGLDCLTKEDVIEMSLSDEVFPPKTSKHGFVAALSPINIPLSQLV